MNWAEHKTYYNEHFFVEKCSCVVNGEPVDHDISSLIKVVLQQTDYPKRVLDCGCATGLMLEAIRRLDNSIEIAGFDLAPYAIDHAFPGIKDAVFVLDCATERIPFDDGYFDLTIAMDFFEHQHDDYVKFVVAEVARVTLEYIFIRQPFVQFNVPEPARLDLISTFNHLTNLERIAIIDTIPEIVSSTPDPDCPYHPQQRGRAHFTSLFSEVGFSEVFFDEEFYIMPNLGHYCSFNTMLLKRETI